MLWCREKPHSNKWNGVFYFWIPFFALLIQRAAARFNFTPAGTIDIGVTNESLS
jgi:hypothetical protein